MTNQPGELQKKEIIDRAARVLLNQGDHLRRTASLLGPSFAQSIQLIAARQGKVVITGMGKAGKIAQKACATWNSVGIFAVYLHPAEALHGDLGMVARGDVVVAVSNSGRTGELINLLPHLKARQVPVIALVGELQSPLGLESTLAIDASITQESCPLELAPMTSTTVALGLLDAMAACLMTLSGWRPEDFKTNHPGGNLGASLSYFVHQYMKPSVAMLPPSAGVMEVVKALQDTRLGAVLIVQNEKLLGIIVEGDIRRHLAGAGSAGGVAAFVGKVAQDIMTQNPITVGPMDSMMSALKLMEDRPYQIGHLPVVDQNNKALGLLRIHDFFHLPKMTG